MIKGLMMHAQLIADLKSKYVPTYTPDDALQVALAAVELIESHRLTPAEHNNVMSNISVIKATFTPLEAA